MTVVDAAEASAADAASRRRLSELEVPTADDLPEAPEGSPSKLSNPHVQRQLSPSISVLERRAAEREFELLDELDLDASDETSDEPAPHGATGHPEARTPSPAKVRRFQHGTDTDALGEAGGLAKWKKFYTEESVKQRVKLMQHPKVKQALDHLWLAANFNAEDDIIDKEEYVMMHRKIVLALEPSTYPKEAVVAAHEDWPRDSEGKVLRVLACSCPLRSGRSMRLSCVHGGTGWARPRPLHVGVV